MLRTRVIVDSHAALVASAVLAAVFAVGAELETLVGPLRVVPGEPAPVTLRVPRSTLIAAPGDDEGTPPTVLERRFVVPRGSRVEDPVDAALVRAWEDGRRPPTVGRLLGACLVAFLVVWMLATYLRTFSPGRGSLLRTQVGLFALVVFFFAGAKAYLLLTPLPAQALPVAAVALWAARFLERRTGLVVGIGTSFLLGLAVEYDPTVVTVWLVGTLTAVVAYRARQRDLGLWVAGLVAAPSQGVAYVAATMLFEGPPDLARELSDPLASPLVASVAGGALASVLAVVLQGFAVWTLGAVSRSRLLDLADLDQPLLRKMAEEAPGSWEHSRAMANLAEEAAAAIGADALLTRVGAYYHDLGKTIQPKYFVENLERGEDSPHRELEPDVSADAIMAHVVGGTEILRRGGIPEPVVEFAYTHHGTSIIEYFWHKCLEAGNPRALSEAAFRYPGLRPRTKETAILMLVDSIEAAARTVETPSRDAFEQLVRRIVFVKLKQGQLDESGITVEELRVVIDKLVETLRSVYHTRVKYPWQERRDGGDEALPIPGIATERDVAEALSTPPNAPDRD